MDDVLQRIDAGLPETRAALDALIRLPGVSADPAQRDALDKTAEKLVAMLADTGAATADLVRIDDLPPLVCADFPSAGAKKTLLVYGHYDVQPPGRASQWTTAPFEPVERDGRLYGRGSADDKGGITAYIAATRAFMQTRGAPPCNVRFLVEGEEEIGSKNLHRYFERYPERIAADFVAICDTPNFATGVPALTYRLRGNCSMDLEVKILEQPLHSGRGGGAVPDPIQVIARLIASLQNEDGTLNIPGLDGHVRVLDHERRHASRLGVDDAAFASAFGVLPNVPLLCEQGYSPYEQTWFRPALTVTALDAPPLAQAANQISASARARLSVRTVPDLDNATVFALVESALRKHAPRGIAFSLTSRGGPSWWVSDPEGRAPRAALRALTKGFGRDAVAIGSGGSIGFLGLFARALPGVPCLLMGVEDPPCNAHSENESLSLADWRSCMRAGAYLMDEVSRL